MVKILQRFKEGNNDIIVRIGKQTMMSFLKRATWVLYSKVVRELLL